MVTVVFCVVSVVTVIIVKKNKYPIFSFRLLADTTDTTQNTTVTTHGYHSYHETHNSYHTFQMYVVPDDCVAHGLAFGSELGPLDCT